MTEKHSHWITSRKVHTCRSSIQNSQEHMQGRQVHAWHESSLPYSTGISESLCELSPIYRYWASHALAAWIRVPLYAYKKGRFDLLLKCLASEALYLAFVSLTAWANFVAALWLLIIPFVITSLALMFGNWWVKHLIVAAMIAFILWAEHVDTLEIYIYLDLNVENDDWHANFEV